jgi:hypothetical protein
LITYVEQADDRFLNRLCFLDNQDLLKAGKDLVYLVHENLLGCAHNRLCVDGNAFQEFTSDLLRCRAHSIEVFGDAD